MAWEFYAIDRDAPERNTYNPKFGPYVKRRWVKSASDPKRRKKLKAYVAPFPKSSDSAMERKAAEYARWLAERDGIAWQCSGRVVVIWDGVDNVMTNKWEKRIRAVKFGTTEIALPNWDWCPIWEELVDLELPIAA